MPETNGNPALTEEPVHRREPPAQSKSPLQAQNGSTKQKPKKPKKKEICKLQPGTTVHDVQLLISRAEVVSFNPKDCVLTLESLELRNVFFTGSGGNPEKHVEEVFVEIDPDAETVRFLVHAGPRQRLSVSSVDELLQRFHELSPEEQEEINRKIGKNHSS